MVRAAAAVSHLTRGVDVRQELICCRLCKCDVLLRPGQSSCSLMDGRELFVQLCNLGLQGLKHR